MAKKSNSYTRANLAKRLKRRGLIGSIKNVETQYLIDLWEHYKDMPTIKPQKMVEKEDNYSVVKRILDSLVEQYKEIFIGWFRDAWRYLPEIEYFYQRIDKNKINNDKFFVPIDVKIQFLEPSGYHVNGNYQMEPWEIPDYLKELYGEYLI